MITLFGATGTTGTLIAKVLAREGLTFRLAGRSADRLAALSAQLPGAPGWVVADVNQPDSLASLFKDGTRLLINCAGPFTELGERVVSLAALNGVHYLDTTNELSFRIGAQGYNELARKNGAAVVPACAYEVAPADCMAAQIGQEWHAVEYDSAEVLYRQSGPSSAGTRRSALLSLATSWMSFQNGGWKGEIPGSRAKTFPLPSGDVVAIKIPSCEAVTIPAHLPVRSVNVWMSFPRSARWWGPVLIPLAARLARSILRPLMLKIMVMGAVNELEQAEADSRFEVIVTLLRGQDGRSLTLKGRRPYHLTAEIVVYTAQKMLEPSFNVSGVLAPSQVVDPRAFLEWISSLS